jgi:hypothetical protein
MKIVDMIGGYFSATGLNEVTLVSTIDDPTKFRQGLKWVAGMGRSLGCWCWNFVRPDGVEEEMVLIQGKMTEDREGNITKGGEFYLGLKAPNTGSTDDAMIDSLVATVERGFEFKLPISAPNLNGGAVVLPKKIALRSLANGKYVCAEGGGSQPLQANRNAVGPWEEFEVIVIE